MEALEEKKKEKEKLDQLKKEEVKKASPEIEKQLKKLSKPLTTRRVKQSQDFKSSGS